MRILSIAVCAVLSFAITPLFAAQQKSATDFTISSPSNIPGATLPSGSYSIHVVNRLSDRYIVQVDSSDGAVHSTFLGIPNGKLRRSSSSGIVDWSNSVKGSDYLRGWNVGGRLLLSSSSIPRPMRSISPTRTKQRSPQSILRQMAWPPTPRFRPET